MIINKKRHKDIQVYKEKGRDSYILIDHSLYIPGNKNRWGKGPIFEDQVNSIGDITTDTDYLEESCYPVSWRKTPQKWRDTFIQYILGD